VNKNEEKYEKELLKVKKYWREAFINYEMK